MAFSMNPEGRRPPLPRRQEVRQALIDALNSVNEANRSIVEALLTDTGDTCSAVIQRAYTQLGHSANNLRKAQACLQLPPNLQHMVERRRRF